MHINKNLLGTTTTQSEMAKILRLSQPRITQLVQDDIIKKDEVTGKILVFPSLEKYYKIQADEAVENGDAIDYDREHARLEKLKADKEEIRVAKLQGELYEAKVVELAMQEIYTTLRTQLLGIPSKLAARLPEEVRGQVSELMTQELEGCLAEMSSYDPEMFAVEDTDE